MASVTITRNTTLPDSSAKSDFHNLIDTATLGITDIVNADIKSDAAIADTKLAQITTASKVSGASITALASVPSGAGVLPNINHGGGSLQYVIDGGGAEIETGIQGDVRVPFACTITGVYLLADQSGSIVVDIWKDTLANFPPTDADTITASAVPTISTDTDSSDTTLTGWTTSVTAGDILRFNVDSVTDITRCAVIITFDRA